MRPFAAIALMLLAVVAGVASGGAQAQAVAMLEPTAAQRCLTVTPDAPSSGPAYPFVPFKQGKAGKVSVELRFTGADLRPAVTVLSHEGGEAFVNAVTAYARHLRVPCFEPREIASIVRLDYVFQPDVERPVQPEPQDGSAAQRRAQMACVRHTSGKPVPAYPRQALRKGQQGRIVAQLRFESADAPPVATVYGRRSAALLREEIEDWVTGLRMPCHAGEPVAYTMTYIYQIERQAYGFVPGVSFHEFLATLPPEQRERMPPDSTVMGCPFDVRFLSRQPELPNHVDQLGNWRAERLPFLEWLRTVTVGGAGPGTDVIFGDSTRLQVPCFKIQSTAQANPSTNKE